MVFFPNLSTVFLFFKIEDVGFTAKETTISWPEEIPPSIPPALFELKFKFFLSCEISKVSNKSIAEVERSYSSNKNKGWGAIAKDLGIKPGSSEFHTLKSNGKSNASKSKNKGKGNSQGKGKGKK